MMENTQNRKHQLYSIFHRARKKLKDFTKRRNMNKQSYNIIENRKASKNNAIGFTFQALG